MTKLILSFQKITAKDLIEEYNNLYIIRTFAKAFGLVASRAGYVISKEENIQELLKIRGPYDVNMFAKTAILAALQNTKYMQDYVKEAMEISKPKLKAFLKEKGISFYPGQANFLLLKMDNPEEIGEENKFSSSPFTAARVIESFKSKGILVRPKFAPDGKEAVRVSIGTLEDTERFIETLKRIIKD